MPAPGAERLEHIDALRGFALALVLLVHLLLFSLYEFLSPEAQAALPTAHWDNLIGPILVFLFRWKAVTIFILFFGVSFALQVERMDSRHQFSTFFIRRLLVLLLIGIVHGIFWFGDILRYYALMGFLLLPTTRFRPRTLLVTGIVIALFPWTAFDSFIPLVNRSAASWRQLVESTLTAFSGSNIFEMLRANIRYDCAVSSNDWTFPLTMLGRLLIGVAMGRSVALARPKEHARTWCWVLIVTLPVGIGLTAFTSGENEKEILSPSLRGAASLSLAFAYIAIFLLLFQWTRWKRWTSPLVAVGRIGLTNYLLQTLIAIVLFYGVGFGIGPRFGLIGTLPFFAAIFVVQIVFSEWWLARFRFGPVEWIWRCLSYGFVIPIRKNNPV